MMNRLLPLILSAVLLAGCGEGGTPAGPPDPGDAYLPPPGPEHVFVAFGQALRTQTPSIYESILSADFTFSPTPEDSLRDELAGTGVFDDWTRAVETSVLAPLFSDAKSIRVEFTPSEEITKITFVRYRVGYNLYLTDPSDAVVEYRGVASFDVRNELERWRLVRWKEIENVDGYESWGFLRGILRPRLRYPGKA